METHLTIKHLAAYLPYRIMVENLNYKIDCIGIKRSELVHIYSLISKEGTYFPYYKTDCGNNAPIEKCMPILRLLSDLAKEIEINGEKIIPIIELAKICFYVENKEGLITKENCELRFEPEFGNHWYAKFKIPFYKDENQTYEFWCFESGHGTLEFRWNQFIYGQTHGHALNHTIEMIDKLKEMHFDIYFLIKKGLAIDINTLR